MPDVRVPDLRDASDPLARIDPTGRYDSTAGLYHFVDSVPNGTRVILPFHLAVNGQFPIFGGGKSLVSIGAKLYRTETYAWRVTGGLCAAWLYDLQGGRAAEPESLRNPYGTTTWGGFDGTTGKSGADYDGKHVTVRLGAPFNRSHIGQVFQGLIGAGTTGSFQQIITGVSDDGTTVYFDNNDGTVRHQDSSGTIAWCITAKGQAWSATYLPNPAWHPYTSDGGTNHPWDGYKNALTTALARNQDATVHLEGDAKIVGIQVVGANGRWANMIPSASWSKTQPLGNEFQHCVETSTVDNEVDSCRLTYSWGDGEHGPAHLVDTYIGYIGRVGFVAHCDGKLVERCVVEKTRRSLFDVESTHRTADVQILNNTFGGPHGAAITSPIDRFTYLGNRSMPDDVAAGIVKTLGTYSRVTNWSGGGTDWDVSFNDFGRAPSKTDPAFDIRNVAGLSVQGNYARTKGWFLSAPGCTDVFCDINDGGPDCLGQMETTA